jgi:hypothetical protein
MRLSHLLAFGILTVVAPPISAQGQPKRGQRPIDLGNPDRYVHFDLPDDIESRIGGHLKSIEALEPFKKLIDNALRDPKKFKLDAEALKNLQLDNPKLRQQVKDWMAKQPIGKQPSPEDLRKLKGLIDQAPRIDPPPPASVTPAPAAPPTPIEPGPVPPDRDDRFRDWLKGAMERAGESQTGDWLRESPAWQQAFENLQLSLKQPPADTGGWGLDKLTGGLISPDKVRLPETNPWESLSKFKPVNLPRWNWTMPSLPRPTLPPVSTPSLPTASAFGALAAWLLGIGLLAVLLWQAARWLKLAERSTRAATQHLGAWPLDPRHVATRSELVQAFDFLALLVLGPQARTWNHNAIARSFAQRDAAHAEAAGQLAALYEQARYVGGDDMLPDSDRAQARQALSQLAGAAMP